MDLPANVFGTLIVGLLTPTSTLLAAHHMDPNEHSHLGPQLAFFPKGSALQTHTPLHTGWRTAFCGSLTTFSGWLLQMVVMTVGRPRFAVSQASGAVGSQWVAALWGCFLGSAAAMAALVIGQQCSLWIGAWLGRRCKALEAAASIGDLKRRQQEGVTVVDNVPDDEEQHAGGVGEGVPPHLGASAEAPAAPGADRASQSAAEAVSAPHRSDSSSTASSRCWPQLVAMEVAVDAAAAVNLCVLTGLSLAGVLGDGQGLGGGKDLWFAVLFGPAGALARWQLARFNGQLPGRWAWFPIGTFAANQLACTISFGLEALRVRAPGQLAGVHGAVVLGVMSGLDGCLSTVSTWAAEVSPWDILLLTGLWCMHAHVRVYRHVCMGRGMLRCQLHLAASAATATNYTYWAHGYHI